MEINQISSARDMFGQLSTEKLEQLLDTELHQPEPDANAVRLILDILRERDREQPCEITPQMREAWESYQEKTDALARRETLARKRRSGIRRALAAAAVVAVVFLAIVPGKANAETFWEALQRWTAEIVEFFGAGDNAHRMENYQFTTDNPGLQQVYDAVVELGVTEPVVPMWLPESGEAIECKTVTMPVKTGVVARLPHGDDEIIYKLDIYHSDVSHTYHGDGTQGKQFIQDETTFHIIRNNDAWVVFWTKDNIECSIAVDCLEDDLYKILESIYTMEDL